MIYKRFRFNCILRVALLAITILLFFFLVFRTSLFAATFIIAVIILYEIYDLMRYVDKTNKDLSRFLQSIKYGDFSQSYKEAGLGTSFDELKNAFTEVSEAFRKARAEKEEHFRYLQTVVQHIGIGLIAFQPNGEVELINTAAKRLLQVPSLKNIQSLSSWSQPLVNTLFKLKPRENALVKIEDKNELLHLALYSTEFKLRGQIYKLVSLQNIYSELEEKEMEAWQKLIRVLTHEIMNSITPIVSLTSTVNELIHQSYRGDSTAKKAHEDALNDVQEALQTIRKRSQGLLHFVEAYRNLAAIPKPNFQIFLIRELFTRAEKLMQAHIQEANVRYEWSIEPETLELAADPELIEQVLINLQLNALQAVSNIKDGHIRLEAGFDDRGRIIIQVIDNGPGIPEENLEKIFIPFFSTKDGGSGIGLSLSRQIMRLHQGTISVQTEPNVQTVFTLRF